MIKKQFLLAFTTYLNENFFYVQRALFEDKEGSHFTYEKIIDKFLKELGYENN